MRQIRFMCAARFVHALTRAHAANDDNANSQIIPTIRLLCVSTQQTTCAKYLRIARRNNLISTKKEVQAILAERKLVDFQCIVSFKRRNYCLELDC